MTNHGSHHTAESRLAELLTRASWRLRRGGKKELSALGLTFGQARALRIVVRSQEPLRMGELAARLEIVPRSATTTVDALEAAGLVTRRMDADDRRSMLLEPTAEGRALIERVDALRRESATEMFGRLEIPERQQLLVLLAILCETSAEGDD